MKREHIIRAVAGTLVLTGLAINQWWSAWGLVIPAFVGVNLVQSSFTHWCLLEDILKKYRLGKASA